MNIAIIKGNLTRDPETAFTKGGVAVCTIGLAVNEAYKTKDGELKERTLFIDAVAFGKQAESVGAYMAKGSPVLVEGALQLEQWENEKKEKRSKISIRANRVEFLHRAPGKPAPADDDVPAAFADGDNIPF